MAHFLVNSTVTAYRNFEDLGSAILQWILIPINADFRTGKVNANGQ